MLSMADLTTDLTRPNLTTFFCLRESLNDPEIIPKKILFDLT